MFYEDPMFYEDKDGLNLKMKERPLQFQFAKRKLSFMVRWDVAAKIITLGIGSAFPPLLISQGTIGITTKTSPPVRNYREGELIAYKMQAINQDHTSTVRYEAYAEGQVKRDASGTVMEELSWTSLSFGGELLPLSVASKEFHQDLSLSPNYKLSIPDLTKVQPGLIGPIVDLLTFYADVQLAMKQQALFHAGDHVYVKHGTPNSWADGRHTVFGQDAVDFDITLNEVDEATHVLTLVVRHVPPAQSRISFPAAWMSNPDPEDGPVNNWAQVQKEDEGKYLAGVGRETFEATIRLYLPSGQILSAAMQNLVNVLERECHDAALSVCGPPMRYQIHRQITVEAVKP